MLVRHLSCIAFANYRPPSHCPSQRYLSPDQSWERPPGSRGWGRCAAWLRSFGVAVRVGPAGHSSSRALQGLRWAPCCKHGPPALARPGKALPRLHGRGKQPHVAKRLRRHQRGQRVVGGPSVVAGAVSPNMMPRPAWLKGSSTTTRCRWVAAADPPDKRRLVGQGRSVAGGLGHSRFGRHGPSSPLRICGACYGSGWIRLVS